MRRLILGLMTLALAALACNLPIDRADVREVTFEDQYPEAEAYNNQLLECHQNREEAPVSDCIAEITDDPLLRSDLARFYDCQFAASVEQDPLAERVCFEEFTERRESVAGDDDPPAAEEANTGADSPDENAAEEPPVAGEPNLDAFCTIYQEMLDDNHRRVEEYIAAIDVEGSDLPDQIALEADLALDAYFDQLAGPAPDEIRPDVEAIAAGSLVGLLSSPDGAPALEGHLEKVSQYAHANCDLVLPEPAE